MNTTQKYLARVFAVDDESRLLNGFRYGKGHGGVFQPDSLTCYLTDDETFLTGDDIKGRIDLVRKMNPEGYVVVGIIPLNDEMLKNFRGLWQVENRIIGRLIERMNQIRPGGGFLVQRDYLSEYWCTVLGAKLQLAWNSKESKGMPLDFKEYDFVAYRGDVESRKSVTERYRV